MRARTRTRRRERELFWGGRGPSLLQEDSSSSSLYVLTTDPYKQAKGARILLGGTNSQRLGIWGKGK